MASDNIKVVLNVPESYDYGFSVDTRLDGTKFIVPGSNVAMIPQGKTRTEVWGFVAAAIMSNEWNGKDSCVFVVTKMSDGKYKVFGRDIQTKDIESPPPPNVFVGGWISPHEIIAACDTRRRCSCGAANTHWMRGMDATIEIARHWMLRHVPYGLEYVTRLEKCLKKGSSLITHYFHETANYGLPNCSLTPLSRKRLAKYLDRGRIVEKPPYFFGEKRK